MALGQLSLLVGANIDGLVQAMKSMSDNILDACTNGGENIDTFTGKIGGISPGASEMMESVTGTFGQFSNLIATSLTSPITAAIAVISGIGTAAFEAGEMFETASYKIQQQTGATGDDLESLNSTAESLFASLPTSMGNITAAMDTLHARFGVTNDDLETLSTYFLNLSHNTSTPANDLAQAASAMATMWQIAADDVPGYMNQILTASQQTAVPVNQLVEALTSEGAVLQGMGLSITEATALLAQFGAAGVAPQQAMAGLRTLFQEMSAQDIPNMKNEFFYLANQMAAAKSPQDALNEGLDLLGKRGAIMGMALHAGAGNIQELVEKMETAATDSNKLALETQTLGEKFTILKNNLSELLAPLGDVILTLANNITGEFLPAVDNSGKSAGTASKSFGDLSSGLDLTSGNVDITKQAFNSLISSTNLATDASGKHTLGTKEFNAAKAAQAAAIKAAAEQTELETGLDNINAQALKDRNTLIDEFNAKMGVITGNLEMWTQADVDWSQRSTSTALDYFDSIKTWNAAMLSDGLTSTQSLWTNLQTAYGNFTNLTADYYNGMYTNDQDFYIAAKKNLDDLKTFAQQHWQGMTQDQQDELTKEINQAQTAFDAVSQTAAGKIDSISAAWKTLGVDMNTQDGTNVANAAAALQAILDDSNSNDTQILNAKIAYYKQVQAYDQANNSSLVQNDKDTLAALQAQLNGAVGQSGTLTTIWADFGKDITSQEKQWGSTIANDLFNGSGSVLQRLGDAFKTIGEGIAKAFITAPIQVFTTYITQNLLNGTLFSSLTKAFTDLGSAISGAFNGGITSLSQFLQVLTGARVPGVTTPGFNGSAVPIGGGGGSINSGNIGTLDPGTAVGSATDVGDGGAISIGDAATQAADSGASSSGGLLSSIGGLGGIIGGAVSGLVSGVITAVNSRIETSQQNKIFENIQNDTDLLRERLVDSHWMEDYRDWTENWLWNQQLPALNKIGDATSNAYQFLQTWVVDNTLQPMVASLASIDTSTKALASMSWTNQISISIDDVNNMAAEIAQAFVTQLQLKGLAVTG